MSWEVEYPPKKEYKSVPATKKGNDESSDVDLIRACKLWDKITEKMHEREFEMPDELQHASNNQPYSEGDYRPLQCKIQGKFAELTVGSSTGHKAKVDLEKKTLEYFDTDADPNQAMSDLLEEAGLECKIESDGVKCKGVTKENVEEVFKVLAMPTSMDFRIANCKQEKRHDPTDECAESCQESLDSDTPNNPCDCSTWMDECTQECVDNYEYDDDDEGDCVELEKKFFREGPKKEKLTRTEEIITSKSQKKMSEWK